ncbi:hypothetical protein DKT77_13240 [Meridianimarinicoccus roseus]|uniref:VPLPA-CTERM sorting domain-containing protein n=1 Tax=Meridianimarinicoccus roseus TaxID=2072018 RepID=A0A2V2LED9_9RHOB|nr:hypothetical protein DKT77_13240 [Meridianimarinicoccus roseus]
MSANLTGDNRITLSFNNLSFVAGCTSTLCATLQVDITPEEKTPPPIPLPGALPLMAGALALTAALRTRRRG